jgi:hypothetical protein
VSSAENARLLVAAPARAGAAATALVSVLNIMLELVSPCKSTAKIREIYGSLGRCPHLAVVETLLSQRADFCISSSNNVTWAH